MSKRQWLCVMGAWILVLSFLGIEPFWKTIILAVSGALVVVIAYNLPHERVRQNPAKPSAFVENGSHGSDNQPPVQ